MSSGGPGCKDFYPDTDRSEANRLVTLTPGSQSDAVGSTGAAQARGHRRGGRAFPDARSQGRPGRRGARRRGRAVARRSRRRHRRGPGAGARSASRGLDLAAAGRLRRTGPRRARERAPLVKAAARNCLPLPRSSSGAARFRMSGPTRTGAAFPRSACSPTR